MSSFKNKDILQIAMEDKSAIFIQPKYIDGQMYIPVSEIQLKTICRSLIDYQKHRYINRIKYKSILRESKKELGLDYKESKPKEILFIYNDEVFNKILHKRSKTYGIEPNLEIFKEYSESRSDEISSIESKDSLCKTKKIVRVLDEQNLNKFIYKDFIYEFYHIKPELEKDSDEYKQFRTLSKDIYIKFSKWFLSKYPDKPLMGRNTFYFHLTSIFLKKNIHGPRCYFGIIPK